METPNLRSPHVLAIPFPFNGHITPLLSLCKILAASAAAVSFTFLVTQRNQQHLDRVFPPHHHLRHPHGRIRCVAVPDGLPLDFPFSLETGKVFLQAFENLPAVVLPILEQIHSTGPPFVCVLSDSHMGWTQDVANKFGVPRLAFFVTVAAECHVYYQALNLISTGVIPFKGLTSESPPIHLPGLPALARTDFPGFLQVKDTSDMHFRYFVDQTKRLPEASMVLFNSFLELENSVLACMDGVFKARAVGPLFMVEEKMAAPKPQTSPQKDECIAWLDKRPPNSVIYVSFGSMKVLSPGEAATLAEGLEASQQAFLWALLPDAVSGEGTPLPDGFLDRIANRGLVVKWASQKSVLRHPSVGGFLTHCGWNAVTESIVSGVPMLICPLWSDHMLISKLLVDEWKMAMKLKESGEEVVKSEAVEKLTRELMEGEKGSELRKRAVEWSVAAKRAVEIGGSSGATIEALIQDFRNVASTSNSLCFDNARNADSHAMANV